MPRFRINRRGDLVPVDGRPRHLQPDRQFRSSARWRRTRARQIARQPWCGRCLHEGSSANPLTADHIVPVAEGGAVFDEANLQILCVECNRIKTREDQAQILRARKTDNLHVQPDK